MASPISRQGLPPHNEHAIDCSNRCVYRLNQLTKADLAELARFASFRLCRVGLQARDGEDLVQSSLASVLLGLESPSAGRHPRPSDLANHSVFLSYLKGIICSLVHFELRRSRERFRSHSRVEEESASEPFAPYCHPDYEFRDLKQQLFAKMIIRTEGKVRTLVLAWDEQCHGCGPIPSLGLHRRIRANVRKVAVAALRELTTPNVRQTRKTKL